MRREFPLFKRGEFQLGLKKAVGRFLGPPVMDEVAILGHVMGGRVGTVIDVGAHQGFALEPFVCRGWKAYALEPDPSNREILTRRCPSAVIDPRAVAETDDEELPLFTSDVSTGISTLSPFHPSHRPTASVKTVRLDTFISEHQIRNVDFLKIDIEGYDLTALRTFPWDTHHPRAVITEFEDKKTTLLGHTVGDIARFLEEKGYVVVVSEWDPVIEYGSQHTWRRFVRFPVDLAADSWGNLIAVDPSLVPAVEKAARMSERRLRVRQAVDRIRGQG